MKLPGGKANTDMPGRCADDEMKIPLRFKNDEGSLSMASQSAPSFQPHSESPVWSHAHSVLVQLDLVSSR